MSLATQRGGTTSVATTTTYSHAMAWVGGGGRRLVRLPGAMPPSLCYSHVVGDLPGVGSSLGEESGRAASVLGLGEELGREAGPHLHPARGSSHVSGSCGTPPHHSSVWVAGGDHHHMSGGQGPRARAQCPGRVDLHWVSEAGLCCCHPGGWQSTSPHQLSPLLLPPTPWRGRTSSWSLRSSSLLAGWRGT